MSAPARRRAAVLGSPIAHSLSPVLHRAAYRVLGLDWDYEAIECTETQLAELLGALPDDYVGLSLTMPLKRAVLPLLDRRSETVAAVDAVNTVLLTPEGRVGHNTDVDGVVYAARRLDIRTVASVAVLGAGGTARAAIGAAARLGAATVICVARSVERAEQLRPVAERFHVAFVAEQWRAAAEVVPQVPLVVATTPAGATDGLAQTGWPRSTALVEVVYDPWPTRLAAAATEAGAAVCGGLDVLVGQAAEQVRLMTGQPGPVAAMFAAGQAELTLRSSDRPIPPMEWP